MARQWKVGDLAYSADQLAKVVEVHEDGTFTYEVSENLRPVRYRNDGAHLSWPETKNQEVACAHLMSLRGAVVR